MFHIDQNLKLLNQELIRGAGDTTQQIKIHTAFVKDPGWFPAPTLDSS